LDILPEQREKERLEAERRENERLEAEQREKEKALSATVPLSAALPQDRGHAQAETPPIVQSKGSIKQKPSARVVFAALGLILIVGLIWFVGSQQNFSGREVALVTPTPTPTPTPIPGAAFYNNRGWDFYQKKDYDKAISDYNEYIKLSPNEGDGYYRRGMCYQKLGKNAKAQADFDKAKQLGYTRPESTATPGTTPTQTPTPDAAFYNSRGSYFYQTEDYDEAISDFGEAIRLDPNDAQAYYNRGSAYDEKKDYDKAISDYSEAIRLDPHYASAYWKRGAIYFYEKDDYDKAISDFTQEIKLHPNAVTYLSRGESYFSIGEYDKAISDYSDVIRLDPNDAVAYSKRGLAYKQLGKNAKAKADFDKAKQLGYTGPK
jgi:tetratricopeptide (TPR) repeat protein